MIHFLFHRSHSRASLFNSTRKATMSAFAAEPSYSRNLQIRIFSLYIRFKLNQSRFNQIIDRTPNLIAIVVGLVSETRKERKFQHFKLYNLFLGFKAFYAAANSETNIKRIEDRSHNMIRVEVTCTQVIISFCRSFFCSVHFF